MNLKPALFLTGLLVFASCSFRPPSSEGWESLEGPCGREVTAVCCEGPSHDAVIAGLANGDVYHIASDTVHWNLLGRVAQDALIFRFVSSLDPPTMLYAATSKGLFAATPDRRQWHEILITSLPAHSGIRDLLLDPWKPSVMYVATISHGISKSTDAGLTWSAANGGMPDLDTATVFDLTLHISRPNVILAAVAGIGVVESNDGGATWKRLTEEITSTGSQIQHVLLGGFDGRAVLYATTSGSISMSTNEGLSWSPSRISHEGGEILSLEQSRDDPARVLAGTERGLMVSTNFGASWTDVAGSLPHLRMAGSMHPGKPDQLYAYGESVGFQRTSDNGSNWSDISNGLGGSTIGILGTNERGDRLYSALTGSVLACDLLTMQWDSPGAGLVGNSILALSVASDKPLSAVASTPLGAFRTTDGGRNWQPLSRNLPVIPEVLEIHPNVKTRILAAGENGLFISIDQGGSWMQAQPVAEHYDVTSFTFMPTNAANVFASTRNGLILVSSNGGYKWESSRYGMTSSEIRTITVDKEDRAMLYAWTPKGQAFRTTNSGLEWNSYASLWRSTDTAIIAADKYDPAKVVAFINGHSLYYSMDGGGTWIHLPDFPLSGEVSALLWNSTSGVLYAGIRHQGAFRLILKPSIALLLKE
jgi:photosystem II stability/assembly factor-like uncharacterized protein